MKALAAGSGFTLIELMVTLAVAAVILATAVPSFQTLMVNNRLATQSNQLVTALNLARSEAVKRNTLVTVCKSANPTATPPACTTAGNWEQGWVVFTDGDTVGTIDGNDTVIRVFDRMNGTTLRGVGNFTSWISYRSSGVSRGDTPAGSPLANGTFRLCSGGAGSQGRNIVVNVTGRLRVENVTC